MGQTTGQIEIRIALDRAKLAANIHELETRLRTALDWRHYYKKNAAAFVVSAVGLGALLVMLSRHRR